MKITSRGRYAMTAVIDIAINTNSSKPNVSLQSIAERQQLSLSYLEQLFIQLQRHHIVKSVRGPGGGYHLTRPTEEISVAQVISAVNENIDARQCKGQVNCNNGHECSTHDLWQEISDKIYQLLDDLKLSDIINKKKKTIQPIVINKTQQINVINK